LSGFAIALLNDVMKVPAEFSSSSGHMSLEGLRPLYVGLWAEWPLSIRATDRREYHVLSRWSIYWIDIDGGNEIRITPAGRDFFTPAAFHTGDRRVAMAFQDANKIRCSAIHFNELLFKNGHTRLDCLQPAVSAESPSI